MDKENHNKNLTLLSVLAHPDDESFGMGGTLALYARQGVKVYLLCATRGEVGDVAPEHMNGYASVAELRENELRCAAGMLGLTQVHFLDYRDSGMPGSPDNHHPDALAAAPLDEVAAKITCYIRTIRPQVVVTFDPIGGYRHPDHIAIHQATRKAFHAAGDPQAYPGDQPAFQPQKLYYHTMPRRAMRWAVRLMPLFGKDPRHFGQNGDIDLCELCEVDFPVHARIDYTPLIEVKEQASACHASQNMMVSNRGSWLLRLAFRMASGKDLFMRAYPPVKGRVRERDLFSGVNGAHPAGMSDGIV